MALIKEHRSFRRYRRHASELTLKVRNKVFNAALVDYSIDGLGVVIARVGNAEIEKGDVVGYAAGAPALENFGEVVWSVKGDWGIRCGIRNIGALKGHIPDYGLEDTLIGLQRTDRTGVLTAACGDVIKKVYVQNGDMIFAASNSDKDRLGDMLLQEGKITREQFDHSVAELKRTGSRQGGILVQLGYLTPPGLVAAVTRQVERIIMDIFLMDKGTFEFKEMPLPTDEIITMKLSVANLIYYGIRNRVRPEQFMTKMPPGDAVPSFASDPLDLFQDIKLDRSGKRIISCIDGKTTIDDVLAITRMEKTEAHRVISALLGARVIEIKGDGLPSAEEKEGLFVRKIFEETPAPIIDPQFIEMVEDIHGKLTVMDHYAVLGIKPAAPAPEIKSAYYKAAKRFHPDMHFYLTDSALKHKLSDIFVALNLAYATLASPEKRAEYDKKGIKAIKPGSVQDRAFAAFSEGKVRLREMNVDEAEKLFGQAVYFDDTKAEYHYHYGLVLAKMLKLRPAKKAFEVAHKLEPANAEYMAELGFVYYELNFVVVAKGYFERALKIAPDNARAQEGLRQVLQTNEKTKVINRRAKSALYGGKNI